MDVCYNLHSSIRSSRDGYRILAQKESMESRTGSDVQRKCRRSQDMVVYDQTHRRKGVGGREKKYDRLLIYDHKQEIC